MAPLIYSLCALTCLAAFVLLLRSWLATRFRLLFWAALCFAVLTLNNLLLVADKVFLPDIDLTSWRLGTGLAAMLLLLFGLIWEDE